MLKSLSNSGIGEHRLKLLRNFTQIEYGMQLRVDSDQKGLLIYGDYESGLTFIEVVQFPSLNPMITGPKQLVDSVSAARERLLNRATSGVCL